MSESIKKIARKVAKDAYHEIEYSENVKEHFWGEDTVIDFAVKVAERIINIEGFDITTSNKEPYIERIVISALHTMVYNPNYGDDKPCGNCGHTYDRHFDSHDDMEAVGCKYCECYEFVDLKVERDKKINNIKSE